MNGSSKGTIRYLIERFDRGSATVFYLSLVLAVIVLTCFFTNASDKSHLGWYSALIAVLFLGSFVRPLLSVALDGYRAIVPVCFAAGLLLVIALVAWFGCYYLITGHLNTQGGGPSKILDVPTLIVALWAASIGWYVNFQLTRRSHRTAHAMSLVLGTRTNAEFQKHNMAVRLCFPDKEACDAIDESFFAASALREFTTAARNEKSKDNVANLKMAQAVDSLKYLLNYYEFMAVGVKLGDIQEEILYETISPTVVAIYDRAEKFRVWFRDPNKGKQPLMLEHLENLVLQWRKKLKAEEASK